MESTGPTESSPGRGDAMEQTRWTVVCGTCQYTKSGPDRADVLFAIEKHSRLWGHIPWEITKAEPRAPSGRGPTRQA